MSRLRRVRHVKLLIRPDRAIRARALLPPSPRAYTGKYIRSASTRTGIYGLPISLSVNQMGIV